jgi:pyruvate dehydrogenase E2 component (dihydrolipoamide acetyltransferase)
MATELKLPNLGENVHAGNVVKVLVSEGDVIAEQQPILELETDKAAIEVPSPQAGRVLKVLVKEGDTVEVGAAIIALEPLEGAAAVPPEEKAPAEDKPPAAPIAGLTKAEPPTQAETPRRAAPPPKPSETPRPTPEAEEPSSAAVPAAPSVRRFAREIGVDIAGVQGSGPGGRISIDDVKAYAKAERAVSPSQGTAAAGAPAIPLPDFGRWGEIRREPFSSVRRATARQMAAAWSSVPQVTQFDKADVTDLEAMRRRYAAKVEQAGGKLTVTAIILKVVASALKIFPKFNASLDMGSGEIIFKSYFHVGVAVDTDRGLLVPVIRDVDRKNILQISLELTRLSEKARAAKLTLEEMQGGCFTVSNLGGIGGTAFAPIVNIPEVAILGVARSSTEPVYREGQLGPRLVLPLSLSYDHRLIDGADGARFLRWVAEALEAPFLLSLAG